MQFRVKTLSVTEEQRRAINWAMTAHRTPASREKCATFAEQAILEKVEEIMPSYLEMMAVLERAKAAEAAAKK
jgi:DNA phosphorothioation-dependent restriction protein DptG